jgi:hypothetical protein
MPPFVSPRPNLSYKNFEIAILFKIVQNSNYYNLGVGKFNIAPGARIVIYVSCLLLEYKIFVGGLVVLTLEGAHLIGN